MGLVYFTKKKTNSKGTDQNIGRIAASYSMYSVGINHHCIQQKVSLRCIFDLFDFILYAPVNNFSVMSGRVFLG